MYARCLLGVSTHSRLKAAGQINVSFAISDKVSTHSRLKAAGYLLPFRLPISFCFNTQPPKGGWFEKDGILLAAEGFNTQPPKGGWGQHTAHWDKQPWFQHTAA